MVTRYVTSGVLYHENGDIDKRVEVYGLSTDTKPTNVPNSTPFYEMDTKEVYMFDATNQVWTKQ